MGIAPFNARREIGDFLRQQRRRREVSQFPTMVRRRRHVGHLTQGDLAELAGVSETLIAQIETGRYANLNPGLLIKLSVALQLAPNQEQYLLNFLQPQNGNLEPKPEDIPDMLRGLVRSSMPNPAMVITPRFDLVDWNDNARRMLGDFDAMPVGERNIAIQMFLKPEMRELWVGWEENARNILAGLRMIMSQNAVYREEIAQLASFLYDRDPLFRTWWDSEDPVLTPNRQKDFRHPRFGILRVYQTVGAVLGSPHHSFLLMTPRDTETEEAFRRMAQ